MYGSRYDNESSGRSLNMSRWLEAVWEPAARIFTLPGCLDMLDVSGDGDSRLIAADLGTRDNDSSKIRVFKDGDQVMEHHMLDAACGVVGFFAENGEPRSALLAVGAGSSVYIFKNMRPFFKYCLPHLEAHPKEREIWHKAGLEEEVNVLTLTDDLELLLKELGAGLISSRSLKFLSLDVSLRSAFVEQYRRIPLIKTNTLTAISAVRKDSWQDPATSYLVIGTEAGDVLILDPRAFSVMDKHQLGWPPVAFSCIGLWIGDGRIIVLGRDGGIGCLKRGRPVQLWEKLLAPAIAVAPLTSDGVVAAVMDGSLVGFSKNGVKIWTVNVPGIIMDMVSLPIPQSGLSLLAVSQAGYGVRIYDGKRYADTVKTLEPVSAMKYGKMGQEERAMAMVTIGGGLSIKILKRTADFSIHESAESSNAPSSKFFPPKKTRLFVEQTLRERAEAVKIHNTFQQGFLRLRLTTAKRAVNLRVGGTNSEPIPVALETSVLGLGPGYLLQMSVTNISDRLSDTGLFIVFRSKKVEISPTMINLPLLPNGITIPFTVEAVSKSKISERIQILLCKRGRKQPIVVSNAVLPAVEEDIDV